MLTLKSSQWLLTDKLGGFFVGVGDSFLGGTLEIPRKQWGDCGEETRGVRGAVYENHIK